MIGVVVMSEPDPLGVGGYYMHCGGCDAEMFVTEAQWQDASVHVIDHVGCAYGGGVDLDHSRRHADAPDTDPIPDPGGTARMWMMCYE